MAERQGVECRPVTPCRNWGVCMLLKGRDLAQPLSLAAALCPCWPLGDVCTPSWSAAVSPCRTQQGLPLPGAARPLPWPPGSIKGRPTLSLTRVVLTCLACAVPGTGELGAAGSGRHACHLETASHLDLPLHMSGRHPPPQLSRVSMAPPHPASGLAGEGVPAVRTQGQG